MDKYVEAVTGVVPTASVVGAAADIVAALAPPPATPGAAGSAAVVVTPKEPVFDKMKKFAPRAAGLVGGYVVAKKFWKGHPVLGALAGNAIVNGAYEKYKGSADNKKIACDLAVEGAGIMGALYHKKLPFAKSSPVVGWVLGILAGSAATYFVDGSPAKEQFQWLKARLGK